MSPRSTFIRFDDFAGGQLFHPLLAFYARGLISTASTPLLIYFAPGGKSHDAYDVYCLSCLCSSFFLSLRHWVDIALASQCKFISQHLSVAPSELELSCLLNI